MNEEIDYTAYMNLHTGLKAPYEWHAKNFILGKDKPDYRKILSTREVEDRLTGEVDIIKTEVGHRGAVASGKRQADGTIKWDWNYEDGDERQSGLLNFNMIANPPNNISEYNVYIPKDQHMDPMPTKENENPMMAWKEDYVPTKETWLKLTNKAVQNMKEADIDEQTIKEFIDERSRTNITNKKI